MVLCVILRVELALVSLKHLVVRLNLGKGLGFTLASYFAEFRKVFKLKEQGDLSKQHGITTDR